MFESGFIDCSWPTKIYFWFYFYLENKSIIWNKSFFCIKRIDATNNLNFFSNNIFNVSTLLYEAPAFIEISQIQMCVSLNSVIDIINAVRKILKSKTSADMTYGDQLIFFIDRILNFFYDFPVSIFHYLFVIVSQICLDNFLLLDYFSEQSLLVFPFVLFVRKV